MENQHRKIKGYRELGQHEIDLMNEIKAKGVEIQALVEKVREHAQDQDSCSKIMTGPTGESERERIAAAQPARWASIAATDFQTGLMALTRAVAQPTTF